MNRDLDADIAEKIFKWIPVKIGKDYNGENECEILYYRSDIEQDMLNGLPRTGKIHRGFLAPRYSYDWKEATGLMLHLGLDASYKAIRVLNAEQIASDCLKYFIDQTKPYWCIQKELQDLRIWKEQALNVTPPLQEIGQELGVKLGDSIHDKILPGIKALKREVYHYKQFKL